jgi:RimJ/RimL family protein N-acetyltransferase
MYFLNNIDYLNRNANCPIFIGTKEHWNKGYATGARLLMLKYAFYDKVLKKVWANVHFDNIGFLRMHEKCGYKKRSFMKSFLYKWRI